MFAFGRRGESQVEDVQHVYREEVSEPKGAEVITFPTAHATSRLIEPEKQRSYEEVAQSLGFFPAELIRAQLLEFFETEGIMIFNNKEVSEWLTNKRVEAKAEHWCWRPLREKDIITDYHWGYDEGEWNDGYYSSTGKAWECRPYARLVPQHALEKVARIVEKFGDHVKFFVSHYYDPNVDPFIMVRPTQSSDGGADYLFIFDAWDEPGFGD